jgi:hypothetical protein
MSLVGFARVKTFTKRIVRSQTAQMDCFSWYEFVKHCTIVVRRNKQTRLLTLSPTPACSSIGNILHTATTISPNTHAGGGAPVE